MVSDVLQAKKAEMKELQKELKRLEKIESLRLKKNSPEIKEVVKAIRALSKKHYMETDEILELVLENFTKKVKKTEPENSQSSKDFNHDF